MATGGTRATLSASTAHAVGGAAAAPHSPESVRTPAPPAHNGGFGSWQLQLASPRNVQCFGRHAPRSERRSVGRGRRNLSECCDEEREDEARAEHRCGVRNTRRFRIPKFMKSSTGYETFLKSCDTNLPLPRNFLCESFAPPPKINSLVCGNFDDQNTFDGASALPNVALASPRRCKDTSGCGSRGRLQAADPAIFCTKTHPLGILWSEVRQSAPGQETLGLARCEE